MNNNILIIDNLNNKNNVLQISFVFLCFFLLITIVVFNIYKGNKIILPNLDEELRESSNFHLLKSIGWGLLLTLIIIVVLLYKKPKVKYGINKPIKI